MTIIFCLKATSKGVDIGAHTVIYSVSFCAMFFWGVGGGGGEVGEIYASLVDVTWGTPFNVVCSVLPVILASRHDVDFGSLTKEILKTGGTFHMSRLTNFVLTKLLMKKVGIRKEVWLQCNSTSLKSSYFRSGYSLLRFNCHTFFS